MVYYFFRPNMNLLMGGPVLWDGSGREPWDCLYYDWHHFQTMPEGGQKFDFRSHTSLEVRVEQPQRQYRLAYDQPQFKLDLQWTGIEPPHHFLGMEIEATGMTADNRMHLEQMGRATGWLELRGERMEVDCYALRDTSWGVRQMDGVKRGSYFWAIHDDDNAFHAQVMGEGDEMRVVGGFLKLDGKTRSLVGGKRVVTEMGKVTPRLFDLTLEDEKGRTLEVKARVVQRPDGQLLPARAGRLVAARGRFRRRAQGLGRYPGIPADGAVPRHGAGRRDDRPDRPHLRHVGFGQDHDLRAVGPPAPRNRG